jgi:hypothetical protein
VRTAPTTSAQAKALLDLCSYIDRDSDGWREQPDGSPLVLEWATTPDQRARSRDELRRKDMNALGIRGQFQAAKWPENLKNARRQVAGMEPRTSAASPDNEPSLYRGTTTHKGGQNLARFSHKDFDAIHQKIRVLPDGPQREQLFYEAKRLLIAYMPYKVPRAPHTDGSRLALVARIPPPALLAGVVAVHRRRRGSAGAGDSMKRRDFLRGTAATTLGLADAFPASAAQVEGGRGAALCVPDRQSRIRSGADQRSVLAPGHRAHLRVALTFDHLARPYKLRLMTAAEMPAMNDDYAAW